MRDTLHIIISLGLIFVAIIILLPNDKNKLDTKEGILEIHKIIEKNYDNEVEVYQFTLIGGFYHKSNLEQIERVYKTENIFFQDAYCMNCSSNGAKFLKPEKVIKANYFKDKKAFKINEFNFSTIPVRYQEAKNILKQKGLFKEHFKYFLNYWNIESDKKGNIVSNFTLQFVKSRIGTKTNITYITDYYKFRIDANKLTLIKSKDRNYD